MTRDARKMVNPNGHEARDHAELGGSSAERWVACPGSVFLARQVPKVLGGPDADRGTACHEVLQELLTAFLKYKEDGTKFDEDMILTKLEHDPRVEPDRIEIARQNITDAVEVIWIKVLGQSITGKVYGIEEEFDYDAQNKMYGTVDFWCCYIDDRGRRVLVIFDFKTGRNAVSPKKNGQLAFYGCAARRFLQAHGKDIDLVRAVIFQPNDFHSADTYKETTLTAKQLDQWDKKFTAAAHKIYVQKKATFKVGEWCRFCPAQSVCKKYQSEQNKYAGLKLVDPDAALPTVEVITDAQRVALAMNRGKIEAFLKAVYTSVLNDALRGAKFPGVKVVLGQSRRKWKDDIHTVSIGLMDRGLSPNDIFNSKLKGIGEIEKRLGKGSVDDLTEKPPGRPMLVAADDSRPEVVGGQELLEFEGDE